MRKLAIAVALIAASAARADSPSLAAPGDCAQPIRELDTGPRTAPPPVSSGVAGPPAAHFAPLAVVGDTVRQSPGLIQSIIAVLSPTAAATEPADPTSPITPTIDPISPLATTADPRNTPLVPLSPGTPFVPLDAAAPNPVAPSPTPALPLDPIHPTTPLQPILGVTK
jgi:hypothetical protein